MNDKQWQLTITKTYYPYKQNWNEEERDSELNKIKTNLRTLYFNTPKEANEFFFNRIIKYYEKKYKKFIQCWIDVDSYSFSDEYNYEIVDFAEYRSSYDNYDFELNIHLCPVQVKERLLGIEKFKDIISNSYDCFDDSDKSITYKEIWELMQKCRFWS